MKKTSVRFLAALTLLVSCVAPRTAHAQLSASFTNIFDSTAVLGSGGEYATGFENVSVRGGQVAFDIDYYSPSDSNTYRGVFSSNAGSITMHTTTQLVSAAPDGGSFLGLQGRGSNGSAVLFTGDYGARDSGVFLSTGTGSVITVAATDQPGLLAPDGNPFQAIDEAVIWGGRVAYHGVYGFREEAIQLNEGGVTTTIATTGPGGLQSRTGNTVENASLFGISDTSVAFKGGSIKGTVQTIFTYQGGVLQTPVETGDLLSNGQSLFDISYCTLSGSTISFVGSYIDTSGFMPVLYDGIFTYTGGSLTTLLDTQIDVGPDGTGFYQFTGLSSSGSTVAFAGDYRDGMRTGIFISSGGVIETLLKSGDSLFGSTVQALDLDTNGLDGNTLAFRYLLTDGRRGVATAQFSLASASAPEPGTLVLLALGSGVAFVRRRRK